MTTETLKIYRSSRESIPDAICRVMRRTGGQVFHGHPLDRSSSWGEFEVEVREKRTVQVEFQHYGGLVEHKEIVIYRFRGADGWWYNTISRGLYEFRGGPPDAGSVAVFHCPFNYSDGTATPERIA